MRQINRKSAKSVLYEHLQTSPANHCCSQKGGSRDKAVAFGTDKCIFNVSAFFLIDYQVLDGKVQTLIKFFFLQVPESFTYKFMHSPNDLFGNRPSSFIVSLETLGPPITLDV